MTKYKIIFLFLYLLLSCRQEQGQVKLDSKQNGKIDKTIVLVNFKDADRATIAKGIQTLNNCNPKIIAINALFTKPRDPVGDSLLSQAISQMKNVILPSVGNFQRILTTGDRLIRSQSTFTEGCLAEGLRLYGSDDDVVVSHEPYRSVGDDLIWSFPITIASYYDIDLADDFMFKFTGNTYYYIHPSRDANSFLTFDIDKLDNIPCGELAGKIVLLGYLGPNEEDLFLIDSNGDKKMYGTVIDANIVLNLLENRPADIDNGSF